MTDIKIAVWNANGLSQPKHKRELPKFLADNFIDILVVTETHFTSLNFFVLRNYIPYTTNHPRNRARGGTAVFVRRGITHCEMQNVSRMQIQATCVEILTDEGPFTLSAVYLSPRYRTYWDEEKFSEFFLSLGSRFIAMGDYNAKSTHWGSRLNSPRGNKLLEAVHKNNLMCISTGEPTYWPSDLRKRPDLLDFAIAKGFNPKCVSAVSKWDLSSDHTPIIITLAKKPIPIDIPMRITNKSTNWKVYKKHIEENCNLKVSLKSKEDIECATDGLTQLLVNAARASTAPRPVNCPSRPDGGSSGKIKDLLKLKSDMRARYRQTRSPIAKAAFNKLCKIVKKELELENDRQRDHYFENLSPFADTDYSLWKAVKSTKRPKLAQPPLRKPDDTWARLPQEKADLFAAHLKNVFTPNQTENPIALPEMTHVVDSVPVMFITPKQVSAAIKAINIKKAPGWDQVNGKMIKELPVCGVMMLTFIINAIMRIGYFPSNWKVSTITMIPKPGKNVNRTDSYRPISLLPILSKVRD